MKWAERLFVFAAATFIGLAAAAMFSGSRSSGLSDCVITLGGIASNDTGSKTAPSPVGIRVTYAGVDRDPDDSEPRLRFVIYNGLTRPISYRSYRPDTLTPRLKANGDDLHSSSDCGIGMQTFNILPGGSAEIHVYKYRFVERPGKTDQITASFYLKPAFANEFETHTSEPFLLPDEFRESIKPNQY